jgi:murein DD-endopeptidase MepM/ murein hydrolase activator NlpD
MPVRSSNRMKNVSIIVVSCAMAFISACGSTPNPENTPAPKGAAPTSPGAIDVPSEAVTVVNKRIQDGVVRYAEQNRIAGVWKVIAPKQVGQILGFSQDKQKVLFLSAEHDSLGYAVPGLALYVVNLADSSIQLINAGKNLFVTGSISPDGSKVAAVALGGKQMFVWDDVRDLITPVYQAEKDRFVTLPTWNPESKKIGFLLDSMQDPEVTKADVKKPLLGWADLSTGLSTQSLAGNTAVTKEVSASTIRELEWVNGQLQIPINNQLQKQDGCSPGVRAGNAIALKLPYGRGSAYVSNSYCGHLAYSQPDKPSLDFIDGEAADGKPVLAVAPGTVVGVQGGYSACGTTTAYISQGNYVTISHLGTDNQTYSSHYYHVTNISVGNGNSVNQGSQIATVHCVGYTSDGNGGPYSHIHFTMRQGSNSYQSGTSAALEPADGYGDFSAGNWYTSTNGGIVEPPVVTPPAFNTRLLRTDNLALNFRIWTFRAYSWLWPSADGDPDQNFRMYTPGSLSGNAGWMLKRLDNDDCLNANAPSNGSSVYGFACSGGDGDQQWELHYYTNIGKWFMIRRGSNQCLNAYAPGTESRVNMFSCDTNDVDQRWSLTSYPGPVWNLNTATITSSAMVGQTPGNQSFTITNDGMVAGGHLVGGPASYQLSQTGNWFVIPATGADLSRGVDRPNASNNINVSFGACTAVGTVNGTITVSGSGGAAKTINVSRTCNAAPTPATWVLGPTNLSLPAGAVGGVTSSATYSLTNTGQSGGDAALTASNGFTLSQPSVGLTAGQKFDMTVFAPACTVVGTQSSTLTATGNGNTTSMNVTRVCAAAPTPQWTTNPTALTFTAYVGSTPANQNFSISNTGTAAGTFTLTGSSGVTGAVLTTSLATNASTTATASVGACTTVGTTTGQLTISGGGSTNATVSVTRVCDAALQPAPSVPFPSSITMSSNGRIFIAWPEISGATQYDFQATFGGAAISVTGQATNRGGTNGSAVANFMIAPDAADKQGKQVCFAMRASNTGGPSAFSSFACTTYKYYAGGLTVQSASNAAVLQLR